MTKQQIQKIVDKDAVKKDPVDHKDHDARRVMGAKKEEIPTKYSAFKQPFVQKVKREDQDASKACMSYATQSLAEIKEQKENRVFTDLSPRSIYYYVALPDGGSYPRANLKTWHKRGIATEANCSSTPATEEQLRKKPSEIAMEEAKIYQCESYAREYRKGDPHFLARMVYENDGFLTGARISADGWYNKTHVRPPKAGEKTGGHGFYVGAYDLSVPWFKFLNSWGPGWGENGFGYFGLDYIKSDDLFDIWTVIDKPNTMNILNQKLNKDSIIKLYRTVHRREPDKEALDYWSNKTLGKFLEEVMQSDEWQRYTDVMKAVHEIEKWARNQETEMNVNLEGDDWIEFYGDSTTNGTGAPNININY